VTLAEAAASIASGLGWAVFPLQPDRKVPATQNGLHAATTDLELINRWWQRCPAFNIGVSCGPSGLVVVDCDVKGDVDGLTAWFELGARHGPWVDTLVVSTPTGGEHWWFTTGAASIGNSAGKLAAGIDTRGNGGYCVAAPSVVAGQPYEVLTGRAPAPLPDWLAELLAEPAAPLLSPTTVPRQADGYGQTALESELGRLALAPEGQRNDTLVRAAYRLGQLVGGHELEPGSATSQLLAVALRVGLCQSEAERTIRSGLDAGIANPRGPR
jgi:Bifunctional DNA primase/polymerase, N-terminal